MNRVVPEWQQIGVVVVVDAGAGRSRDGTARQVAMRVEVRNESTEEDSYGKKWCQGIVVNYY